MMSWYSHIIGPPSETQFGSYACTTDNAATGDSSGPWKMCRDAQDCRGEGGIFISMSWPCTFISIILPHNCLILLACIIGGRWEKCEYNRLRLGPWAPTFISLRYLLDIRPLQVATIVISYVCIPFIYALYRRYKWYKIVGYRGLMCGVLEGHIVHITNTAECLIMLQLLQKHDQQAGTPLCTVHLPIATELTFRHEYRPPPPSKSTHCAYHQTLSNIHCRAHDHTQGCFEWVRYSYWQLRFLRNEDLNRSSTR